MNPKVDAYFTRIKTWQAEQEKLRAIALDCGLDEALKWGKPCYAFQNTNLVIIQPFKDYCALMFFKGALLNDPKGILVKIGDSQAGRQVRFTNVKDIAKLERVLKAYIFEAIEVEKAGLKVPMRKTSDYPVPEEFQAALDDDPALKAAFEALTPGRQRAYLFHFSSAKQSKTRAARVEKYIPQILDGRGLND